MYFRKLSCMGCTLDLLIKSRAASVCDMSHLDEYLHIGASHVTFECVMSLVEWVHYPCLDSFRCMTHNSFIC